MVCRQRFGYVAELRNHPDNVLRPSQTRETLPTLFWLRRRPPTAAGVDARGVASGSGVVYP